MSILFCIISQSVLQNQWYLTLYTQILFSSTNLYLPGPFPLTLCIICAAFIAFMIQQHLLELGDINDASGVFFVIKRLGVVIIINNRLVQNRFPVVILRMSDFNTLKITCLAVLVRRIITDIDLFTVIMSAVPFILESNALISRNTVNK